MLGVHEMCNRELQWKEAIPKSGKLRICVHMHAVHYAKRFRRFYAKLQVLYGALFEGGQEEGQSKYGQNLMKICSMESPL